MPISQPKPRFPFLVSLCHDDIVQSLYDDDMFHVEHFDEVFHVERFLQSFDPAGFSKMETELGRQGARGDVVRAAES